MPVSIYVEMRSGRVWINIGSHFVNTYIARFPKLAIVSRMYSAALVVLSPLNVALFSPCAFVIANSSITLRFSPSSE